MSDVGPITMTAAELEMRHNAGGRFRLVAMLYMEPSEPPKVAGPVADHHRSMRHRIAAAATDPVLYAGAPW